MYKILIVDDEKWIRKGIISKLTYHRFKFSNIFEAENGQIALNIIEEERPHIVITDIRMPVIDGIELIKCTRKKYADIKFLIVSGYADFAYAEQAINMGVNGYILKPIKDNNFVESIGKVITDLNANNDIKRIIHKKEKLEKDNQNYIFGQRLNQVLHTTNEEMILDEQKYSYYLLGVINIDETNFNECENKYSNMKLIKEKIKSTFNQVNKNCKLLISDNYNNNNQIIILFMDNQKDRLIKESNSFIFEVFNCIKNDLKVSIIVGISEIHEKIKNTLYKQAIEALGLRLIHGYNKIYHFNNIESNNTFVFPEEKIKLLKNYIESYKIHNIKPILQKIFAYTNFKKASTIHVKYVWLEITNMLIQFCRRQNFEKLESLELDLNEEIFNKFDNLETLVTYLYTIIIDLLSLQKAVDINTFDVIIKAKKYIDKHYGEEISVKQLANKLAIHPNYLSTLFKKEIGKTFTAYLAEMRIEKACELLVQTKGSVAQISQIVGYKDPQYFYRIFKKNTGITPLAYRNNKK